MKQPPDTPLQAPKKSKPTKRKGRRFTKWDSLQKEAMTREFNSNEQNISKTARVLGLSRNAVLRKLKRYDLKNQEKQP